MDVLLLGRSILYLTGSYNAASDSLRNFPCSTYFLPQG
jgi:hypothetical protein